MISFSNNLCNQKLIFKEKNLPYSCTHVDSSSSNALYSTFKLYIIAILYEYEQLNVN